MENKYNRVLTSNLYLLDSVTLKTLATFTHNRMITKFWITNCSQYLLTLDIKGRLLYFELKGVINNQIRSECNLEIAPSNIISFPQDSALYVDVDTKYGQAVVTVHDPASNCINIYSIEHMSSIFNKDINEGHNNIVV